MGYAEKFYKQLVEISRTSNSEMYSDQSAWTKFIKQCIQDIFKCLENQIEVSFEYYRIDAIGWIQLKNDNEYKDMANNCSDINMDFHLWKLYFAAEFENNSQKWIDEVCKLAYINCPLRVIVSYGKEKAYEKVTLVKKILKELNAFTNEQQEFAIILGEHKDNYGKDADNPCGYELYTLYQKKDILIKKYNRILRLPVNLQP